MILHKFCTLFGVNGYLQTSFNLRFPRLQIQLVTVTLATFRGRTGLIVLSLTVLTEKK